MQSIGFGAWASSILFTLVSLLAGAPSWAQTGLESVGVYSSDQVPANPSMKTSFVSPNERDPQEALGIWNEAPGGLYLSVGTERGFIGASLANNTTHLLLVDVDPKVMIYDRMNIALMKLSKDRKDYLQLRYKTSQQEWLRRASLDSRLSKDEVQVLSSAENYKFWKQAVNFKSWFMYDNALPKKDKGEGKEFNKANYLVYDDQFLRLKSMADSGRIRFTSLNLNDQTAVSHLVKQLSDLKIKINVLDISNAWWGTYVAESNINYFVKEFAKISTSESLLLMTEKAYFKKGPSRWDYFGFRVKELADQNAALIFRKSSGLQPGIVNALGESALFCSRALL